MSARLWSQRTENQGSVELCEESRQRVPHWRDLVQTIVPVHGDTMVKQVHRAVLKAIIDQDRRSPSLSLLLPVRHLLPLNRICLFLANNLLGLQPTTSKVLLYVSFHTRVTDPDKTGPGQPACQTAQHSTGHLLPRSEMRMLIQVFPLPILFLFYSSEIRQFGSQALF